MHAHTNVAHATRHDGSQVVSTDVTVGAMIRDARLREGMSLSEVTERCGVSTAQISRIENGQTKKPSDVTLGALASALQRSPQPLEYVAHELGEYVEEMGNSLFDEAHEAVGDDKQALLEAYKLVAWRIFVENAESQEPHGLTHWAEQLRDAEGILRRLALLPKGRRTKVLEYLHDQEQLMLLDIQTRDQGDAS